MPSQMDKIELVGVKDHVKYYLIRTLLVIFYVVSHIYDYLCYPVFMLFQSPWLVRRYRKANHARMERRGSSEAIFHSLEVNGPINVELERHNLTTMDAVFKHVTEKYGKDKCLGTRQILSEVEEVQPNGKTFSKYELGDYHWRSFSDLEVEADKLSKGLTSLGLKEGDKVAMIAETRAEWLITAYACFKNNLSVVTIYTNLGNDGIIHALTETKVTVAFCSHDTLKKLALVSKECPDLKHAILMKSQLKSGFDASTMREGVQVQTFESVLHLRIFQADAGMSCGTHALPLNGPIGDGPTADDTAIIMYTSGSTGKPKGVMLTHRNLIAAMSSLLNISSFKNGDRYIGYLPLAHVLELLAETSCLLYGIRIGYSSPLTLTNKSSKVKTGSKGDANVLRPTLMCAVPLILERIYKSIVDTMRRQGWAVEELFHYFVAYKMKWQDRGFDTPLLNKTLFRKIRYFLGGRVRLLLSGGAPLSPDTHSLVRTCLCVPLMQGYGLTETTACASVTSVFDRTTGRAGAPLLNVKMKLVNWEEGNYLVTDKPNPRGEIHVGGDNVAKGYYENREKTAEEFYDEDDTRWFRTGDIGEVDEDGVFRIIDRKKDLVKLQGGEYVSYGKVESVLKTNGMVENMCLHADPNKDYTVAVIVPNLKHINETLGADLTAENCNEDADVKKKVVDALAKFGLKNGLEKFEVPKKIHMDAGFEWTPDSGLVTAAFKIRRRNVYDYYEEEIAQLYS